MAETPLNQIIDNYIDDDKALALSLAVSYWGMVGQNPSATPAGLDQVQKTANVFLHWLRG